MRMWILGAPDPEMQRIEDLLAQAGEQVAHALDATGQRVHPGNAYRATALSAPVPEGATVYAVECGGPAVPAGAVVIDHHRPGDPGYGRPPAEFLPASSIGQVISELARLDRLYPRYRVDAGGQRRAGPDAFYVWDSLRAFGREAVGTIAYRPQGWPGWYVIVDPGTIERVAVGDVPTATRHSVYAEIPALYVLAAAADHCLAAAYRGECPGVDPDALRRWRVETRAAHQGRPAAEILADVDRARERLRAAPRLVLGSCGCAPGPDGCDCADRECTCTSCDCVDCARCDIARAGVADLREETVPELPEAAAREGVAYLATVADRDGRQKVVLGAADPESVRAFLASWAPTQGLVDLYGDPARGFAGGYVAGAEATERMDG